MKLSRIALAGAFSLTLALAGCSNGDDPEPDTTASEAPEETPEDEPETPEESDDAPSEEPEGAESDSNSDIDTDAHPFCAAVADFDDIGAGEGEFTPTEADLPLIKEKAAAAVAAAPENIKDDAEIYFDTFIEVSERAAAGEEIDETTFEDMEDDEELENAFGSVLNFLFETCVDLDFDLDLE